MFARVPASHDVVNWLVLHALAAGLGVSYTRCWRTSPGIVKQGWEQVPVCVLCVTSSPCFNLSQWLGFVCSLSSLS